MFIHCLFRLPNKYQHPTPNPPPKHFTQNIRITRICYLLNSFFLIVLLLSPHPISWHTLLQLNRALNAEAELGQKVSVPGVFSWVQAVASGRRSCRKEGRSGQGSRRRPRNVCAGSRAARWIYWPGGCFVWLRLDHARNDRLPQGRSYKYHREVGWLVAGRVPRKDGPTALQLCTINKSN